MTPTEAKQLKCGDTVIFDGRRPAIIESVGRFGNNAHVAFEDSQIPGRWFGSNWVPTSKLERD